MMIIDLTAYVLSFWGFKGLEESWCRFPCCIYNTIHKTKKKNGAIVRMLTMIKVTLLATKLITVWFKAQLRSIYDESRHYTRRERGRLWRRIQLRTVRESLFAAFLGFVFGRSHIQCTFKWYSFWRSS